MNAIDKMYGNYILTQFKFSTTESSPNLTEQ